MGYHERVAGDLDRWQLDAIVADRPLRVQHRSGALWVLNTAALTAVGLADGARPPGCEVDEHGRPTGRLYRLDDWLRPRIPTSPVDLAAVGTSLAASGVTGVTDATPFRDLAPIELLADAVSAGELPVRVTIMGAPALDPRTVPAPLTAGPAKVLLADHDLPTLDEVVADMRTARAYGRAVAVHCVTRTALVLTLAAFDVVGSGAGDRIEHGAVIGPDLIPWLVRRGVTVVTQPNFVRERGDDYLTDVPAGERDELWPCRSLLDAGVPVRAGTDAPYGRLDPWALIHAAVERLTETGRVLVPGERISARRALDLLLRSPDSTRTSPRQVAVGSAADLCVLHEPLSAALGHLPANPVCMTIAAGVVTHGSGSSGLSG